MKTRFLLFGVPLVVALALSACSVAPDARLSAEEATPEPSLTAITPTATPFPYATHTVGETFEFEKMRLTVRSVQVADTFPDTDGGTFQASPGEDLVLLSSHFVNLDGASVDLSCSGIPSVYIEMLDVEGRTIEPLFDTYRIPGNPECNYSLLSGQESDYNTLWRMVEGSQPLALQMTDTASYDTVEFVNFTDEELVAK
jgi:hypothetical protein